jgi:tetratricopeptide (TPR) repeat protein
MLAVAGTVLAPATLETLAQVRNGMRLRLDRMSVSVATLDQWEEAAASYGYSYQTTAPMDLLFDAVLDFDEVQKALAQVQPLEFQRRLLRISAQLAGIAGIALVQAGERREAQEWFHVAHLAADETGDRALRGWVIARQAVIPFYFGSPRTALALAHKARTVAGATASSTAAWAPSLEARALARINRASEARAAMGEAKKAFLRLSASDTDNTAYGYTERQLRWHEGSMYTALGEVDKATEALTAAHRLYSPTEHLDRALITFDQLTCVARRDVGAASRDAAQLLLEMPDEHRPGIVVSRAHQFDAEIPSRASSLAEVRQFREALKVLSG